MEFLKRHPEAVRMRYQKNGYTGLHIAAGTGAAKAVEEMVQLMEEEDLEIKDNAGQTAFYHALTVPLGNNRIVDCLVRKNKALVYTGVNFPPHENVNPVRVAVSCSNWEVANYLYRLTPKEALKPENGRVEVENREAWKF